MITTGKPTLQWPYSAFFLYGMHFNINRTFSLYKIPYQGTTWGDIRPKRQKIAVTRALKRQSAVLGRFGQAARPAT